MIFLIAVHESKQNGNILNNERSDGIYQEESSKWDIK